MYYNSVLLPPPPVSNLRNYIEENSREGFAVLMTVKPSRFFCA